MLRELFAGTAYEEADPFPKDCLKKWSPNMVCAGVVNWIKRFLHVIYIITIILIYFI